MVQVVKVSPAAVPDVQISVRFMRGLATIRLKGSNVALPAVLPFAAQNRFPRLHPRGRFAVYG